VAILIATIDYYIQRHTPGFIIPEQRQKFIEHFNNLKPEVEAAYQKKRLTKLRLWLNSLTEEPRETEDFNYSRHIKETTGYDLDIFDAFKKRVNKIIQRNKIINEHEYRDVMSLVDLLCQQIPADELQIKSLNELLGRYDIAESRR